MWRFFVLGLIGLLLCGFAACSILRSDAALQNGGSSSSGFVEFPDCHVSPAKAVELAGPHLQQSFNLRQSGRAADMNSDREPTDIVTRKGDWYYVVRESYPAIMASFYLAHAVRVHTQTGEVIEPL